MAVGEDAGEDDFFDFPDEGHGHGNGEEDGEDEDPVAGDFEDMKDLD